MSRNLQDIEGIGPKYAELLKQYGINTTEKFLEVCGNLYGRKGLADKTSINEKNILKWVHMCDLFRINGVAGQYALLLEGSGVNTLNNLRSIRNPEILALMMAEVNKEKRVSKITPSPKTVSGWVEQAKELQSLVTH